MTEAAEHRISVHLDELLQRNGMTLVDLSSRVGGDRREPALLH